MNTSSSPCACPLLEDKKNLPKSDRVCHVPATRIHYLGTYPGQPCHDGTKCTVCPLYPEKAAQEVAIRVRLARRQQPLKLRVANGRQRMQQVMEAIHGNKGVEGSAMPC